VIKGTFSVTDTTRNAGPASTGVGSTTRYYLSADAKKGVGDKRLTGVRSVPALAGLTESSGSVTVTVPATTKVGMYFLLACADGTKTVTESNEANNCKASGTKVEVRAPDLIEVAPLSNPPVTAAAGSTFPVTDTVKNQGNATAGASTTRYYLSTDAVRNIGDRRLTGTRAVPSLAANATSTNTVTVTIPSSTPAGTYFLLACADDLKKVAESNEKNNCIASAGTVTVTP